MVSAGRGPGALQGVAEWGEELEWRTRSEETKREGSILGHDGLVWSRKTAENNQMKWRDRQDKNKYPMILCSNIIPTDSTKIWYLSNWLVGRYFLSHGHLDSEDTLLFAFFLFVRLFYSLVFVFFSFSHFSFGY